MATISFYTGAGGFTHINNLSGSGLGFFGAGGFGTSVEVGAWQGTTYITDSNGTISGGSTENTTYYSAESGINNEISPTVPHNIRGIPNRLATLNIRFEHDSAVKIQNAKLRIFDRSNVNNAASGVVTKVAQLIHVADTESVSDGLGDASWNTPAGSAVIMDLVGSPGISGIEETDTEHTDTRHDYYVAISASPNSIGAKTLYGLYVELEYL